MRRRPVVDYFGRVVEVGDMFFTGNPPIYGRVIKVREKSLMLDVGVWYGNVNRTRDSRAPEQGIIVSKLDGTEPLG
jgi:hypothetical protein